METVSRSRDWQPPALYSRYTGLAITLALHIVIVFALLQYEPVRLALSEVAPIMVSLINPVVEKPQVLPKPLPVKPRIEQPKHAEPPLITAVSEAPPAPEAPAPPTPAPVPAPVEIAAPKAIAVEAPPAPVTPPNFNADYLDNPPPAYPALSRRMGEQGRVVLRVLVNPTGAADKIELKTSSGSLRLDDAALGTVKRWRFVPARQGNQPVAAWVLIPITFTLKG